MLHGTCISTVPARKNNYVLGVRKAIRSFHKRNWGLFYGVTEKWLQIIVNWSARKETCIKVESDYLMCLFTYSMVQSPSWEATWFAASREIHRISRNPKVHYRTHKRPPPVLILGQPNPVHIPTSHLLEIHSNIIHSSMPRSPQWSLSLRFPHQDPIHRPLLTHTCHMPSPSHSSRSYHPHNIGWGVQII